jgi:hypothetical protein
MHYLKKIFSKIWGWFLIAGAVYLLNIALDEYIKKLILENPSSEFYLRLVKTIVFAVPIVAIIYLAIKKYEENQ